MVPAAGAALIRVAAYPTDLVLPPWPDLTSDHPDGWRNWLRAAWDLPGFAEAVTTAAPQLAGRVDRAVTGELLDTQRLRRLVKSAVRYLLRWTTRATPFGTFAGIAPVAFGAHASVRVGTDHRTIVRPNGQFLAEHAARAEQDLATLRTADVVTNQLGYRRGDRWVLPCARTEGDQRWDVEVGLTSTITTAIESARSPVRFTELAAKIAADDHFARAESLLAGLVQVGVLLSSLRPAVIVADPATQPGLHHITEPGAGQVAIDLRADVTVTLPPAVLHEADKAASTLVKVAPNIPGWAEYRDAFIERWGPGTAVPLRDVLNVLGFPAGYRGSTRRIPAVHTARDRLLGQLAQQSLLDGTGEVVLDDTLIGQFHGDDDRPPIPHTELRFALAAHTPPDLDKGAFTLTVLSGSRHAGVSAARFLHLLNPAELTAFRQVYRRLPTAVPGAETVQLSGPPLDTRLTAVARIPELLPVLPVGEFHPEPPHTVDDLAVAGDGQRLWLTSRATGRIIEPLLLNSVLLPTLQQPLMRFLVEIWSAWSAPCARFDWGHASSLPFLPRVRHGRSILHPARWIIDPATLPARAAGWPEWRDAWQRHRQQLRLPDQVLVGEEDVRLRLDLDDDAQVTVLRDQLDRHSRTTITETPGPAGWIDDRPAEILLTLSHPTPDARTARPSRGALSVQHWPGQSQWLEARLFGRADDLLTDLSGRPAHHLPPGWWFLRYPDPAPHLRLRIPLSSEYQLADIAARLAHWAQELSDGAVLHDYSLHVYRPEARHGSGATLAAAGAVFAADSDTCLRRLTGDRQATTAASMIAIAEAFTNDGLSWLAAHVPHRTGPRLDHSQLDRARVRSHDDRLSAALTRYRSLVEADELDPDQVLADLLHLHHARMIGVDDASEKHCLRLTRAIARATQTRKTP